MQKLPLLRKSIPAYAAHLDLYPQNTEAFEFSKSILLSR